MNADHGWMNQRLYKEKVDRMFHNEAAVECQGQKMSQQEDTSDTENQGGDGPRFSCWLCHVKFPSKYLLHHHVAYMHKDNAMATVTKQTFNQAEPLALNLKISNKPSSPPALMKEKESDHVNMKLKLLKDQDNPALYLSNSPQRSGYAPLDLSTPVMLKEKQQSVKPNEKVNKAKEEESNIPKGDNSETPKMLKPLNEDFRFTNRRSDIFEHSIYNFPQSQFDNRYHGYQGTTPVNHNMQGSSSLPYPYNFQQVAAQGIGGNVPLQQSVIPGVIPMSNNYRSDQQYPSPLQERNSTTKTRKPKTKRAPKSKSSNAGRTKDNDSLAQVYECKVCDRKFSQAGSFHSHMKLHEGDVQLHQGSMCVCGVCKTEFTDSYELQRHMHKVHTGDTPYKCELCDRTFSQYNNLRRHLRVHNGNSFKCHICGRTFNESFYLEMHLGSHTGERTYRCGVCNITFKDNSELQRHVQTHNAADLHTCDVCGKSFSKACVLRQHKKMHSGLRPFKCEICNKSFIHRHHLKIHSRMHSTDKPYTCKICGKDFHQTSHLYKHLRLHSDAGIDVAVLQKELSEQLQNRGYLDENGDLQINDSEENPTVNQSSQNTLENPADHNSSQNPVLHVNMKETNVNIPNSGEIQKKKKGRGPNKPKTASNEGNHQHDIKKNNFPTGHISESMYVPMTRNDPNQTVLQTLQPANATTVNNEGYSAVQMISKRQPQQTSMDQDRQLNIDQGRQFNIEQSRQLNIEQGRQLNIEQGRQLNSDQGRQLNSDESKLSQPPPPLEVNMQAAFALLDNVFKQRARKEVSVNVQKGETDLKVLPTAYQKPDLKDIRENKSDIMTPERNNLENLTPTGSNNLASESLMVIANAAADILSRTKEQLSSKKSSGNKELFSSDIPVMDTTHVTCRLEPISSFISKSSKASANVLIEQRPESPSMEVTNINTNINTNSEQSSDGHVSLHPDKLSALIATEMLRYSPITDDNECDDDTDDGDDTNPLVIVEENVSMESGDQSPEIQNTHRHSKIIQDNVTNGCGETVSMDTEINNKCVDLNKSECQMIEDDITHHHNLKQINDFSHSSKTFFKMADYVKSDTTLKLESDKDFEGKLKVHHDYCTSTTDVNLTSRMMRGDIMSSPAFESASPASSVEPEQTAHSTANNMAATSKCENANNMHHRPNQPEPETQIKRETRETPAFQHKLFDMAKSDHSRSSDYMAKSDSSRSSDYVAKSDSPRSSDGSRPMDYHRSSNYPAEPHHTKVEGTKRQLDLPHEPSHKRSKFSTPTEDESEKVVSSSTEVNNIKDLDQSSQNIQKLSNQGDSQMLGQYKGDNSGHYPQQYMPDYQGYPPYLGIDPQQLYFLQLHQMQMALAATMATGSYYHHGNNMYPPDPRYAAWNSPQMMRPSLGNGYPGDVSSAPYGVQEYGTRSNLITNQLGSPVNPIVTKDTMVTKIKNEAI